MNSGTVLISAPSAPGVTLFLDNLQIGANGNRDAYTAIQSYQILQARDLWIYGIYRDMELHNGSWVDNAHLVGDATSANYISGGASLYLAGQEAGIYHAIWHDAGVFDSGLVIDTTSAVVGQFDISDSYFDHYNNLGLKMPSTSNNAEWIGWSNVQFVDYGASNSAECMSLNSAAEQWTMAGLRCLFYPAAGNGIELNGAKHINISTAQVYPITNGGTAIIADATTATNNIVISNSTIGIGLDSGGNSHTASYGLRFVDSSSSNFVVTGNTLRGTTAAVSFATSSGGGMQFANNLGLNTAIPLIAVSGSTLTVGVYPVVGLSSTAAFSTMTGSATAGQQVTVINYTGSPVTINTGGNFGLGHTLAANGGSETFSFDGTNWY
jgi:hypothetical protein